MKRWNSPFNAQGSRLMFETNYSSCTSKSTENICSRSEGAQEKGKTRWNLANHQNWWPFEFHPPPPPLNVNVLFSGFFIESHQCLTKLRVPVLCLSYFTNNSINLHVFHPLCGWEVIFIHSIYGWKLIHIHLLSRLLWM
jgi:hypothetical protein